MFTHPKDMQFALPCGSIQLEGILNEKIQLVTQGVLKKVDMYALADYFRNTADMFATGEFWGKIMRAACMVCGYTQDPELRQIIDNAVADMLSLQDENGCISTCPTHTQPQGSNGSDLWERKYVLMGLLSYYELTGKQDVLNAALALVKYTHTQVGESPKTPITQTGWAFGGIESSSILEPVMRVYHLTGDLDALSLGTYIVESGCCCRENIFKTIREGKSPMDIGNNGNPKESIAKAYEMMSCFEGLCEYYRATGEMWALETIEMFWDKVKEEEITLLGSGGADAPFNLGPGTGEQWNKTRFEQTNPNIHLMMETCVTVYWMRLCHQLLRLTGKVKYMDAIEVSLYNPILGAIRPDGCFFEYFPRLNGTRNPKVNYSFNIKGFDLSCCTANGPTGLALAPYLAVAQTKTGIVFNMYESGRVTVPTESGHITLEVSSQYPQKGHVSIRMTDLQGEIPKDFDMSFRAPAFAEGFTAKKLNEDSVVSGDPDTYLTLTFKNKQEIEILLTFNIPLHIQKAPHGSCREGDDFVALTYGSLVLSRDQRDGVDPLTPVPYVTPESYEIYPSDKGGYLTMRVKIGEQGITLCDYMTAGNGWDGSAFATWLPKE